MIDQKGQSLVEMIVIIGMVVLLATGIVAGTTMSLSRSKTAQTRSEALAFAQAGIELTRTKRDQGWDAFVIFGSPAGTYCVGSDGIFGQRQTSCTVANINNIYTRSIALTLQTVNEVEVMNVVSLVSWGDQSLSNQVHLATYLTQWR